MAISRKINTFLLLCAVTSATAASLVSCGGNASAGMRQAGDEFHTRSELFTLTADRDDVFVEHFKAIHYANFTAESAVQIEAAYEGEVGSLRISPLSRGIVGEVNGNKVSFTVPGPGWYVVEVNGQDKLILLIDRPEEEVPDYSSPDVLLASDYADDLTGTTLQTARLQKALDDASASGKTLVFTKGVYRTGTLVVGSDTDIYLAADAMIKGSDNRDDYPSDNGLAEADHVNNKENYTDNGEFMTFSRLLLVDNANNVRIRGRGIIDGSGTVVRAQGKPANLIRVRNSRNVSITGVILRDPAAWNTHILMCDNVTIRDVKVLNDFDVANTDGFDPDASRNVLIENCFAYCNDDNVAIKTTNNLGLLQDLENITVRGCVFITRKSSLKVGTETKAGRMRNILFEDNDVIESDRAFALYCNDGAHFQDIRFVNNRVERNYPDSQRKLIHFSIKDRYGKGRISDVLIKDCDFLEMFPKGSAVGGLDEAHRIDGLILENVTIEGRKVTSITDLGVKSFPFVDNIEVR